MPILQAQKGDFELHISDFRIYQDAVLDQLFELDMDSEFSRIHAPITSQIMEDYYLIKAICYELGIYKKKNTLTIVSTSSI